MSWLSFVDHDDSLVSALDVDERALDVLLPLVGDDVDLVVGHLLSASAGAGRAAAAPAAALQRLYSALVARGLRGPSQSGLFLHGDGGRLAPVGLATVTGRVLYARGARLTC